MFKLIESQNREMKEVLSGSKVVWENNVPKGKMISIRIVSYIYRDRLIFQRLPDKFNYFIWNGIKVSRSDLTYRFGIVYIVEGTVDYYNELKRKVLQDRFGDMMAEFFGGGVILNQLPLLLANIVLPKAVA